MLPIAFLAALSTAGCRDAISGFGTGPHARASADQLFGSFVERHWDLYRNPKYDYAKQHLSRSSLSPSRIYDDTATWTTMSGTTRRLETFGSFVGNRYGMTSRCSTQPPVRRPLPRARQRPTSRGPVQIPAPARRDKRMPQATGRYVWHGHPAAE